MQNFVKSGLSSSLVKGDLNSSLYCAPGAFAGAGEDASVVMIGAGIVPGEGAFWHILVEKEEGI